MKLSESPCQLATLMNQQAQQAQQAPQPLIFTVHKVPTSAQAAENGIAWIGHQHAHLATRNVSILNYTFTLKCCDYLTTNDIALNAEARRVLNVSIEEVVNVHLHPRYRITLKNRPVPPTVTRSFTPERIRQFPGGPIVIDEHPQGVFTVVDASAVVEPENGGTSYSALGFGYWDEQVDNLDVGEGQSDEAMCFDMSRRLRWNDVELFASQSAWMCFHAPTFERVKEALEHVYIINWCVLDI